MPAAPQSGRPPKPLPRFRGRRLYRSSQRRPFRAGRDHPGLLHTRCALCRWRAAPTGYCPKSPRSRSESNRLSNCGLGNRDTAAVGCDGAKSWDKDTPVSGRSHSAMAELLVIARRGVCLYQKCRELSDRQASPTACVIDSQSVKKVARTSIPPDTMPARRAMGRNGISWWIPRAC